MTRKLSLSAMTTLALVFIAGITAGAMAQSADNKPGGASSAQPAITKQVSDNKPGGASSAQPTMANQVTDNKPGGASTALPANH
jgi:hypothetical protein